MTISELNFLSSISGKLLLERYADYDEDALFHLLLRSSKRPDITHLSAAVTLIKLRRKAQGKFSKNSEMFFTTLGLEQASSEKIALYIASRYQKNWRVVDLTSGLGGNLIALAQHCRQVIAVDNNELNLTCAKLNAHIYKVESKIKFVLGNAQDFLKSSFLVKGKQEEKIEAFFIDPARDRRGKSKTRSILNSQPPLLNILSTLLAENKNIGVKISPAFDYKELELLSEKAEIEVISENNTNKVAMLWFGTLKTADRRATILSQDKLYSYTSVPPEINSSDSSADLTDLSANLSANLSASPVFTKFPLTYLYQPNKAIIKAHLIDELAVKYKLAKISPYLPFLSGDNILRPANQDLWRIFKVLAYAPFSWSLLRKFISQQKLERVNVIAKNFPFKPEEVYKRIKIKEGGNLFLILMVFSDEKRYYLLVERI